MLLVDLIMQIVGVSKDIALIILGYIPVRRPLRITLNQSDYKHHYIANYDMYDGGGHWTKPF